MASSSTSQPLRTSLQALFRSTLRTSLRQSRHSRGFSTRRISTRPGFPTISSTTTTITPHHQALLHRFTIPLLRRYSTTLPPTAGVQPTQAPPSLLIRMWNSPVGVKTVHFWAPVMKWALVIAGISDFYRPPEKLSLTQSAALTATGLIWTRWCLIIKPKNYLLAAANFFLGCVGAVQVSRIFVYQRSVKGGDLKEELAREARSAADVVEGMKGRGVTGVVEKVKEV